MTNFGFVQGVKTDSTPKIKTIEQFLTLGTGTYHPDKWKMMHTDDTTTDDVNAGLYQNNLEQNLQNLFRIQNYSNLNSGHSLQIEFLTLMNGLN